jgi:hypothetical protein
VERAAEALLTELAEDLRSVDAVIAHLTFEVTNHLERAVASRSSEMSLSERRRLEGYREDLEAALETKAEIGAHTALVLKVVEESTEAPNATRADTLRALDVLEDSWRETRSDAEKVLPLLENQRRQDDLNRQRPGFDYTPADLLEAQRLLKASQTELGQDHGSGSKDRERGRAKAINEAREEIRSLGLDPYSKPGSVELAQLVNRQRLNAGGEEARNAAGWGAVAGDLALSAGAKILAAGAEALSAALDPVGRTLGAAQKMLIEAPLIALQGLTSALLGDKQTTRARLAMLEETAADAGRLMAARDLDRVAPPGARLAQSTIGTTSLEATAGEMAAGGEDPYLRLMRGYASGVADGAMFAATFLGGFAGAKAAVGLAGRAAGAARSAAGVAKGLLQAVKAGAKGAAGAGGVVRGRVGVPGAAAGRSTLKAAAEGVAGGGRWKRSKDLWKYGEIPIPRAEGMTNWLGQITIRHGMKGKSLIKIFRHERIHRKWSPTSGPFRTFRAKWKGRGYKNSHLLRYTEEAMASGSFRYPFRHPGVYGISGWRLAGEVGLTSAGLLGAYQGGRELGDVVSDWMFGVDEGE